ncbi:nickel ABC transporter substrate-binding protein [Staphylococcus intermedius]|uniref:ABC transporter substrate-binding protein n=1 Tax=Staphylococcus intermedius NCTC 11048 TaxID=1141106 RepID=A0A380G6Y6_STAIN|nr:nickel ABC transporter substrate-binding protein [Staphylococcus intermedius]PCF63946.1 nickel ABC transporter substrate-binding protein [Staphylococcus intermedius]PCF78661.1 nickel ABC transporter substrate-binding protein [Staphylococcus intermedius]PCF79634.1 nickel ABC transporter substrate-binding protein [Staphylococcus intermedius]PCF89707.1 nickel ABC transporter substrate-binding protein [Staphylococcus intermedius]PNZ52477.1 nickel ABC transporter substrate-binding protein [Staph
MRLKYAFAVLTTTTLLLASCGTESGSRTADEKVLDIEMPLKTTSIAPYETDVPVRAGALESLFKVSKEGEVKPWLAKDFKQVSPEKLELTVKDHVTFQNGEKLTGQKVKESIEQALKESDFVKSTLPIKDIQADGQKVTITTKEAYPELASELANPFVAIFDADAKTDINAKPVGTGPYQIKDYQRSQKITLKRNDDYWHGKPKLEGVTVTYQEDGNARVSHLQSGEVDLITDVPVNRVKQLEENDDTKVSRVSGYRTQMMIYNQDSNKMTHDVREALDKVIDRKGLAKDVSNGYAKPATGPFNDHLDFIADHKVKTQDIAGAKKLMEDAGYSAAHPLKIQLVTYEGRPELPKMAQVIQSDAKKAHIDIEIRSVDDIEGYLADRSQWDATMYSFGTIPRGDTGYFFNQALHEEGSINKGAYHNKAVTQMIDTLNHTVDKAQREALSNQIINQAAQDIPASYITYNDTVDGLNKDVTNFKATPEGIYLVDDKVDIQDAN